MRRSRRKSIVIALGNRFRGDDGIGPVVADLLGAQGGKFTIFAGSMDAAAIMAAWEDAALAVVIDAASPGVNPGNIRRLEIDGKPLPKDLARCSSHGLGLSEAVTLGKLFGRLPGRLVIYAVEAKAFEPGAVLSAEVETVAEEVARLVQGEIAGVPHQKGITHA
jgi:hydrogenase maturation protease